ncbi:MAG TPA: caspase family protein [Candidatus Omnitrophota bacterium]|nr:caspase family protein [Candidatus Omnitrophota bacterium]
MFLKIKNRSVPLFFIVCLIFAGIFLSGCLGAPKYIELPAVPGEVYGQGGPLSTIRLGLVYTENTLQAFQYMKHHMSHGHRPLVPFLERVDPEKVKEGLSKALHARFKAVKLFDTMDDAVKSDVDMILAFDYRCTIIQKPGQDTTIDMAGTFTNRQERIIDVVKGHSVTTPAYVSFTYGFDQALGVAFEEFTGGLDKSSLLTAFAEHRSVPAPSGILEGPSVQVVDLQPGSFYRKSWAIVIGINKYNVWPPLEYAVRDAQAVAVKLRESGFDEVIEILDKDATRERILTVLGAELPRTVGADDRVLIFFAGHGQTETLPDGRDQGYIIPVDGDITNYFTTAISMQQVREISGRVQAKHILYVMDACYSGQGFTRSFGIEPTVNGYLQKITSLRSVQMITAGGKKEQAVEVQGHGLFTQYFLRGLDGEADRDNDRIVTASELGAYLMPQVSRASGNLQTPQYGRLDGEGEVVFTVRSKE